jgi:hypothetical protein
VFTARYGLRVCINEKECVYCAVRTECLNIIQVNLIPNSKN